MGVRTGRLISACRRRPTRREWVVIGQAAYAAAKGGVVSLTLATARDLSSVNVRVCCVAPGTIRTHAMESVGEEALAAFAGGVRRARRTSPESSRVITIAP